MFGEELDERPPMIDYNNLDQLRQSAADFLDDTADHLEQYGWCQEDLHDVDGRSCAVGAIDVHARNVARPVRMQATTMLAAWLGTEHPGVCECEDLWCRRDSIIQWNDTPGRTAEDVITGFRKAALTARETVR